MTVARHEGDTGTDGGCRAARGERVPASRDYPAGRFGPAEQQRQQLLTSRSGQAANADDLTAGHVEAHVVQYGTAEAAHAQECTCARLYVPCALRHVRSLTHHQLDKPVLVEIPDREGPNPAAVAQDRDPIGNREDLVESM